MGCSQRLHLGWDGPEGFTRLLCLQTVFAIVSFGAIVLTVNVVLLGGNIGFFQVHLKTCPSCRKCCSMALVKTALYAL